MFVDLLVHVVGVPLDAKTGKFTAVYAYGGSWVLGATRLRIRYPLLSEIASCFSFSIKTVVPSRATVRPLYFLL